MTLSLTDVSRAVARARKCQEWLAFVQFLVFIYSGYMAPTSSVLCTMAVAIYLVFVSFNSFSRVPRRLLVRSSCFANFLFVKRSDRCLDILFPRTHTTDKKLRQRGTWWSGIRKWVRRRSFLAKELEKSNSPVITKDLRAWFGLAIYAMHVTRISLPWIAEEWK